MRLSLLLFGLLLFTFKVFSIGPDSPLVNINNVFPSIVIVKADISVISPIEKSGGVKKLRGAIIHKQGAGVIIDHRGIIVTNAHIIKNAQRIKVTLYNNESYYAKVLGVIENEDLGFIMIDKHTLPAVEFSDINKISLGAPVYIVGSSNLLQGSIIEGQITGFGYDKNNSARIELIQTNINLYKGDSGAPLFNKNGEFLGLMTAEIKGSTGTFSFAIPSYKIKHYYQIFSKKIHFQHQ